jgi:hypothetical protein
VSLSISVLVPVRARVSAAKYRKWSAASGMSAASVSRTGLPLSQVSATASSSVCSSIASAIRLRTRARSVSDVSPQVSRDAWAASRASSMSSLVDRGTSVNFRAFAGDRSCMY